jgi:hypothetical protein
MTVPFIVPTTRKNAVNAVIHGEPVRDVGLRTGAMLPAVLTATPYIIGDKRKNVKFPNSNKGSSRQKGKGKHRRKPLGFTVFLVFSPSFETMRTLFTRFKVTRVTLSHDVFFKKSGQKKPLTPPLYSITAPGYVHTYSSTYKHSIQSYGYRVDGGLGVRADIRANRPYNEAFTDVKDIVRGRVRGPSTWQDRGGVRRPPCSDITTNRLGKWGLNPWDLSPYRREGAEEGFQGFSLFCLPHDWRPVVVWCFLFVEPRDPRHIGEETHREYPTPPRVLPLRGYGRMIKYDK